MNNSFERGQLQLAYRLLDDGDAEGAVYAMRDTTVVERLDLRDVFWAMYQHGTCASEVRRYLDEVAEELTSMSEQMLRERSIGRYSWWDHVRVNVGGFIIGRRLWQRLSADLRQLWREAGKEPE